MPDASVPFTEYSAVGSRTNGTVIGPSYNLYTLAAEAVGRARPAPTAPCHHSM
ncbi:MAG: hypothetical protein ACRDNW_23810 [Trebonia sp.]